jgi:endonuclease I
VVRSDCGRVNTTDSNLTGKGAAARAVFYFLHRYPDTVSTTELPPDRMYMLLDWHRHIRLSTWDGTATPLSLPGNATRNPFIDHPDWASEFLTTLSTRGP